MKRLAINTVEDELEASADFCRAEGIGLEVSAFAFPKNLDSKLPALVERHRRAVRGVSPVLSHDPFLDLVATSLDPAIQAELIEAGKHPYLRASFDNGHALVFSKVTSATWVETLGVSLAHCHLHDNGGEEDEHKSVGNGKEDWQSLLAALARCSPQAVLVAESDRLDRNKVSIDRLIHSF